VGSPLSTGTIPGNCGSTGTYLIYQMPYYVM
jgi:hypothetical protein